MKSSEKLALLSVAIGAVPGMFCGYYIGFWWGVLLSVTAGAGIWQWFLAFTAKVRVVDAKILKD